MNLPYLIDKIRREYPDIAELLKFMQTRITELEAQVNAMESNTYIKPDPASEDVIIYRQRGKDREEMGRFSKSGSFMLSRQVLANAASEGFIYIPTVSGAPTGVPRTWRGLVPLVFDITNNKLYAYTTAWKSVVLV